MSIRTAANSALRRARPPSRATVNAQLHLHTTSNPSPLPSTNQQPSSSSSGPSSSTSTHFGFKDVPESDKETLVGQVFSSVASSYDLMNDAMSFGIHRLWKDHYVKSLNPHGALKCLDVAGGTGDVALRILDYAREKFGDRETSVKLIDINPNMLQQGQLRFKKSMYYDSEQVSFEVGNAEDLKSVESESIDLYTIAFGIRNCTRVDKVLKEAFRVLKPGGRFSCLEFSKVNHFLLSKVYETYSFNVIPNLGHILAGDRDSYQYLVESIQKFPPQPVFAQMIRDAGFTLPSRVNGEAWEDLTFGVASIHTGVKV